MPAAKAKRGQRPRKASKTVKMIRALSHDLRVDALKRIAAAGEDGISPVVLAGEMGESVQLVSYHVRILRDRKLLKLSHTQPRRGAIEHFYVTTPAATVLVEAFETFERSLAAPGKV